MKFKIKTMFAVSWQNLKEKIAHPGFRRYFKNTGWLFFGQFFSLVVAFFVGAYVARYLGPKNFGLMSYAISFVTLFGFLAGFGVDSILSRELIKFPEKKEALIGTSFWLKLIGGLLAIIVINIISFLSSDDYLSRLLIFTFSLTFVLQSFTVVTIFFQSQVLSHKSVSAQIISTLLSAIMKLIFIYYNFGVIWLTALYIFDSLTLTIGLLAIYYSREHRIFSFKVDRIILKDLLKNSLPLMFSVIALTIYGKIDQVIIRNMMDAAAVGIYAVAVKLSETWYFIPGMICTSLFPAVINAKQSDPVTYKKRVTYLYSLLIYLGIFMSAIIFVFSRPVIMIMFGPAYEAAVAISQIYAWSGVSVFLMSGFWTYLLSENYTKIYLLATIIGAISNIILNIVLIPRYGTIGSAYATLISYALPPLSLILYKKTRPQLTLALRSLYDNFLHIN